MSEELQDLVEAKRRKTRRDLLGLPIALALFFGVGLLQRLGISDDMPMAIAGGLMLVAVGVGAVGFWRAGGKEGMQRRRAGHEAAIRETLRTATEAAGFVGDVDWSYNDSVETTLSVFAEAPFALQIGRPQNARHVTTGDREFDRKVGVSGRAEQALATLTAEARSQARLLGSLGTLRVDNNVLSLRVGGPVNAETAAIVAPALVVLARACLPPDGVPAGLVERARTDPHPAVRTTAARLAIRRYPKAPPVDGLTSEWLEGDDPALALLAAEELGMTERAAEIVATRDAASGGLTVAETDGALSEAADGRLSRPRQKV